MSIRNFVPPANHINRLMVDISNRDFAEGGDALSAYIKRASVFICHRKPN